MLSAEIISVEIKVKQTKTNQRIFPVRGSAVDPNVE